MKYMIQHGIYKTKRLPDDEYKHIVAFNDCYEIINTEDDCEIVADYIQILSGKYFAIINRKHLKGIAIPIKL